MDADRYRRVRALLEEAQSLAGTERRTFLDRIDDAGLRGEVARLLEAPSVDTGALAPAPRAAEPEKPLPRALGRYTLKEKLGEGGMGVVYAAEDALLQRRVAIKTIHAGLADDAARRRLWREARTAAAINHPRICQVYEAGEQDGELYIAMELLEGEALVARLARGPLPLAEALAVAADVLDALAELHRRGVVHRDLKPSNIFLTPHGVKLLDFGLARSFQGSGERVTRTGIFVGTPGFMAPEQFTGEEAGPPADLFAAAAVAFEMISGQPAFSAQSAADALRAVLRDTPATLRGGQAVEAADRVIQRALAKRPEDRPASAAAMAEELRGAALLVDGTEQPSAVSLRRLVIVPFRLLKEDDEISFLPFGLADAIHASLSGVEGLVVTSNHVGARYAGGALDPDRIARETGAQGVLTGTLLRGGDRLRASAQLLEAPGGDVQWSDTCEVALDDVFRLQDELARRIADALVAELAPQGGPLQRDVPANGRAYEFYLRANQLSFNFGMLEQARDLYRACLKEDPSYAPAWAQLGRVHRVMGKYGHGDTDTDLAEAEQAFLRALDLNPQLSSAHNLFTYFQIEERGESVEAMTRLLDQARRRPTDPQLLAGLVLACRFCGLLDASIEADRRARRLDPGIRTSVAYTYWAAGDYENAILYDDEDLGWIQYYALPLLGRADEAVARCRARERRSLKELERDFLVSDRTGIEGDREACVEATQRVLDSSFHDPEGRLFIMRNLVRVGETAWGLDVLEWIVAHGYFSDTTLRIDPWLRPLHGDPRYEAAVARAREGRVRAEAAYAGAGGPALLGPALKPR